MAYTPTGTFIPCNTNGFITEKYSKSYKFSIVKPTTYPGEESVNGVIWIMDLEAMSKTESPSELQTAKWAAGKDYSDDDHPVDYPLVGNYYIVSNLYSFPNENPKTKFSIEGNYSIKKTKDDVKYLEFNTTKLFRVKETKELNSNSTVDDLINLALDYLRNDYINTVYGRFADPVWKDAYQKKEEKKITEEKLTEVYNSLGNLPENKISLKIDEAGATTTGTTNEQPGNTVTSVKVDSPTAVAEVQYKFNVEKTDTFIVVGGTVSPPLEFTIVPNDGTEYIMDVFTDTDELDDEYKEDVFAGDEELKNTYESYIYQIEQSGQNLTQEEKDDIAKEMVKYKPGKPSKEPPPDIVQAMKDYGITNNLEKAHFLAQCAHESGQFAWKREFASGKAYEGRKDLGNTQTGDGVRYKGRGYIQITGRVNYTSYNDYLKGRGINDNVVANPELLEGKYAADCSVWFWCVAGPKSVKKFPERSRKGATVADVTQISKWVNGGTNGLQDRIDKFGYYWSVLEKNPTAYS